MVWKRLGMHLLISTPALTNENSIGSCCINEVLASMDVSIPHSCESSKLSTQTPPNNDAVLPHYSIKVQTTIETRSCLSVFTEPDSSPLTFLY